MHDFDEHIVWEVVESSDATTKFDDPSECRSGRVSSSFGDGGDSGDVVNPR